MNLRINVLQLQLENIKFDMSGEKERKSEEKEMTMATKCESLLITILQKTGHWIYLALQFR